MSDRGRSSTSSRESPPTTPELVVDLGCGPGQLTASLADRWPNATIIGIDSSPAMIERAAEHRSERVTFELEDLRAWRPDRPVEVIVSNAALQWVPDHRALLPGLLGSLSSDGWLAFQVPGNFGEPSHTLLRELAAAPRFTPDLTGIAWPDADPAETYLDDLVRARLSSRGLGDDVPAPARRSGPVLCCTIGMWVLLGGERSCPIPYVRSSRANTGAGCGPPIRAWCTAPCCRSAGPSRVAQKEAGR